MRRFLTVLFWWGTIPLGVFSLWALFQLQAHAASVLTWFVQVAQVASQLAILAVLVAVGIAVWKAYRSYDAHQLERKTRLVAIEKEQHTMRLEQQRFNLVRELAVAGKLDGSNVKLPEAEVVRFLSAGRVTINQEATEPIALPAPTLPGPYDFSRELTSWRPSPESIFLGRSSSGLITMPMRKLWHIALAGPTGGGKTNILRLILSQLLRLNALVYLCDIHYAPMKRGLDWQPIAKRLAHPPIRDIRDIASLVEQLARAELQARIDREYRGEPIGDPVYLAIEEIPAVMAEKPEIATHLAKLLRQGRQYDLCFIGATQDMLVKTLGTSSGVRECFRTGYYTGGDMTTARAILDLPKGQTIDEDGLGVEGRVYLKTATSSAQEVRVPFASNQAVYELLGLDDVHSQTEALSRLDVRQSMNVVNAMNAPMNGDERSVNIQVTDEERQLILAAAQTQMLTTGKVIRTKVRDSLGWNNGDFPKIKRVLDEHEQEA